MPTRWLLCLCACLSLLAATARADDDRIPIDIAPQDLPAALDDLAAQAQLQMLFDRAGVRGKKTPGLQGTYTRREALEKLLAGTGLAFTFTADDAVAIKKPERVAANDAAETEKAKEKEPEPTVLPEMTVTASPLDETRYNVPNATTATKTDTPIMETPFSIQVVPQQVFRDQQVVRIEQALQNVSGVQGASGSFGDAQSFIIRGFETPFTYREGVRYRNFSAEPSPEVANLERIEVLKGVASMLYGRIEPGGIINLIRKKPLASPYYALEQQFGSFDFYRTTLDATGPLTQDDTLLYRFNLAYEDAGSFRDFFDSERVFVAPHLRWNLGPRTQADLYIEYLHNRNQADSGIPALGNRPAPVPRERRFDEPGGSFEFDDIRVGFNWSQRGVAIPGFRKQRSTQATSSAGSDRNGAFDPSPL